MTNLLLPTLPILLAFCAMLVLIGRTIRTQPSCCIAPFKTATLWYHVHQHDEMSGE